MPSVQPTSPFVYKPTRRRFLQTAVTLPAAAGMLPLLMPNNAQAVVGTGDVESHSLEFVTSDGKDPGHKMLVIFAQGGLSFFDTFDPKTHPKIKGPFKPIDTAAKGVQITDIVQPLARHMNNFIVVRNMHSTDSDHDRGAAISLTKSSKVENTTFYADTIYTNPFVEFSKMLTHDASSDVGYVVLHQTTKANTDWRKPWGAIKHEDPETVYSAFDTNTGEFVNPFRGDANFDLDRYRERIKLLEHLQSRGHTLVGDPIVQHDIAFHKAKSLADGDFSGSFDLSKESPETLAQYGDTQVGRQLLLAKRMFERGARVVVANDGDYDHHSHLERNMKIVVPDLSKALSAFMDDIAKMEEKVYVAILTEFNRTPVINKNNGRDHWPNGMSLVLAGNHMNGGRAIGKTDNDGQIVGDAFDLALTGDTLLNLLGLGRFETRDQIVTSNRFPYVDLDRESIRTS